MRLSQDLRTMTIRLGMSEQLDHQQVQLAHIKEIDFLHTCAEDEGGHVSTRWILADKWRCKQTSSKGSCQRWKTLFAATPPLESLKYILSRFQTCRVGIHHANVGDRHILCPSRERCSYVHQMRSASWDAWEHFAEDTVMNARRGKCFGVLQ